MLCSFHFSLNRAMLPFREMQKHLTSWHKYLSPCWEYMLFLLLLVCPLPLPFINICFKQYLLMANSLTTEHLPDVISGMETKQSEKHVFWEEQHTFGLSGEGAFPFKK